MPKNCYPKRKNKQRAGPGWQSLFLRDSGSFSSKRVLAFVGFITCIVIFIISFITGKEVPDFGDTLLICCVSLYGVEIGTSWYSKSISKS